MGVEEKGEKKEKGQRKRRIGIGGEGKWGRIAQEPEEEGGNEGKSVNRDPHDMDVLSYPEE